MPIKSVRFFRADGADLLGEVRTDERQIHLIDQAIPHERREDARLELAHAEPLPLAIDDRSLLLDAGDFYKGHADKEARSRMNVTFRLPDEAKEKAFLAEASKQGMVGLAGHRSVGGCRASIYNAVPFSSCEALASLMRDFARRG